MNVALTALATIAVPLLLGAGLGAGVRRVYRRGLRGVAFVLLGLVIPSAAVVVLLAHYPVIGCWDAVFEGVLFGVGVVIGGHAALAESQRIWSIGLGTLAGLVLLEVGARAFLAPPPRFPSSAGVHLWLADSIRASRETMSWDMRSRDLACGVVYGEDYRGILDDPDGTDVNVPARYTPRPDAQRRELHVGDSMVFGLGVERGETFTAALGALEPSTEHVNAGIPGLAPDAYLAVLEAWIARQGFDVVTMYIFDANDVRDLDGPYPCCGFAPLLAYDGPAARLRCPTPTPIDMGSAGFEWLRYNSPPPYAVRALVDYSAAAAYLAAALVDAGHRYSLTSTSTPAERMQHLGVILRTARDELARRGTAFRVVILPGHVDASGDASGEHGQIVAEARRLGIPVLDATPVLRAALLDHRDLFVRPFDPHFNRDGHRLIATWLDSSWAGTAPGESAAQR
jgi:hypothetical protein